VAQEVMPGALMLLALLGGVLLSFGYFFYRTGKRASAHSRKQPQ